MSTRNSITGPLQRPSWVSVASWRSTALRSIHALARWFGSAVTALALPRTGTMSAVPIERARVRLWWLPRFARVRPRATVSRRSWARTAPRVASFAPGATYLRRHRPVAPDGIEEAFFPALDAVVPSLDRCCDSQRSRALGTGAVGAQCARSFNNDEEEQMRPDPRADWFRAHELGATQPRIAVAEDDGEMRRLVVATLRRRGYQVVEAKNGAELVELVTLFFAAMEPDGLHAVVSDIRMGGASGLFALEAIRAIDPTLPVILMTAFPSNHVTGEATRLGAHTLLEKPFDLKRLTAIIDEIAPAEASPPGARYGSSTSR